MARPCWRCSRQQATDSLKRQQRCSMSATAAAIRTIEVALSANPYPVVIGR